jgi:flagellar basal-body rod protein FlgF
MQSNLYVSLSGQIAIQQRLETIASNVANMNTAGYRADGVSFDQVLSKAGDTPVAFVSAGSGYISRQGGDVTKTDNPLDIAVQGTGWLAIQTPGGLAYTRDGRLQMTANGDLQTLNGYRVLDAGGTGLTIDPNAGPPTIASDGMITQGGNQVGAVGLFSIDPTAKLTRFGNSSVVPDKPATAILDFGSNGVLQGYVEGANVNPVLEMTKLITLQRALDGITSGTQNSETSLQDAIKTLGSSS